MINDGFEIQMDFGSFFICDFLLADLPVLLADPQVLLDVLTVLLDDSQVLLANLTLLLADAIFPSHSKIFRLQMTDLPP